MNILGVQIVGIVFGIVFIYLTFLNRKRNELNFSESVFWSILWIGLIVVSIFPNMLNFIVKDVLNIGRTLDFLIIMGFLVMFGVIFYIFIISKRSANKIENLVRKLTLSEGDKNEDRSDKDNKDIKGKSHR